MARTRFTVKNWRDLSWGEFAYIIGCALFTVLLVKVLPLSLRINITESLPVGLYLLDERRAPLLGELGLFPLPSPTSYTDATVRALLSRTAPLLKPVGAVEGDFISTRGNYVWKCPDAMPVTSRCTLLGMGSPVDGKGRPLTLWNFDQTRVGPGEVYIGNLGVHPKSFDSRYIGLVQLSSSRGVMYPLWVR